MSRPGTGLVVYNPLPSVFSGNFVYSWHTIDPWICHYLSCYHHHLIFQKWKIWNPCGHAHHFQREQWALISPCNSLLTTILLLVRSFILLSLQHLKEPEPFPLEPELELIRKVSSGYGSGSRSIHSETDPGVDITWFHSGPNPFASPLAWFSATHFF